VKRAVHVCWFSLKWREALSVSEYSALRGGDFQGIKVYRSNEDLEAAQVQVPALPFIVSMSPPGYPSAWLRPRTARFRFARQDHCSFTTSIRLNFDGP
jgi:hypothetical protein